MATIRLFSFRIHNVAFKNVQPHLLEIRKERVHPWFEWIYLLLNKSPLKSRWMIKFSYKDQNLDHKTTSIFFNDKEDAEYWFSFIFDAVFLEKDIQLPPPPKKTPPPPPPKKIKPLEKINKPNHLKAVEDEPPKKE